MWPTTAAVPETAVDEDSRTWANALVAGTIERVKDADELIAAHSRNWRLERMAVVDRLIMRMALAELGGLDRVDGRTLDGAAAQQGNQQVEELRLLHRLGQHRGKHRIDLAARERTEELEAQAH